MLLINRQAKLDAVIILHGRASCRINGKGSRISTVLLTRPLMGHCVRQKGDQEQREKTPPEKVNLEQANVGQTQSRLAEREVEEPASNIQINWVLLVVPSKEMEKSVQVGL